MKESFLALAQVLSCSHFGHCHSPPLCSCVYSPEDEDPQSISLPAPIPDHMPLLHPSHESWAGGCGWRQKNQAIAGLCGAHRFPLHALTHSLTYAPPQDKNELEMQHLHNAS
jgi:hypothetical protein